MLNIRIKPIDQWPGEATKNPGYSQFRQTYADTKKILEYELGKLKCLEGSVQLAMFVDSRDIRLDGQLRANVKVSGKQGVILSFTRVLSRVWNPQTLDYTTNTQQLSYPCDAFNRWDDNLRAIALSLKALRNVARYGVFKYEETASRLALPDANGKLTSVQEAAELIAANSDYSPNQFGDKEILKRAYFQAAKRVHPDTGGSIEAFSRVKDAYILLGTIKQSEAVNGG